MPQPDPDLTDVVLEATTARHGDAARARRVDDAWEAVVREELVRVRRGHARVPAPRADRGRPATVGAPAARRRRGRLSPVAGRARAAGPG